MGTTPFNFKTVILFPGGGSVENCGVVLVVIVSTKEEERISPDEVYYITVNHHYL